MDIKHNSNVAKLSMKSSHVTIQSNGFSKETSNNVGPHQNPFILHEPIPITPLFGITGLNLCLF